jgi:hypothetical protein
VEVVFEVASERYPLEEQAATLMAENLRVKAAHEPGAEGTVGARAVADAIELRLIEDTADPIILGGDEAEAVFYAPEVPNGGSDRLSALRDAVERTVAPEFEILGKRCEIGASRRAERRKPPSHARHPRATCCPGEEASSSSCRDAKRGAVSAQPYRRLSV